MTVEQMYLTENGSGGGSLEAYSGVGIGLMGGLSTKVELVLRDSDEELRVLVRIVCLIFPRMSLLVNL